MTVVPRPPGLFITLEGGEGAGKSTLARGLARRLEAAGRRVVLTREPGGSPGAELVRHVLLSGAAKPLGPLAEALLFGAARSDHLDHVIRPALARGDTVLCDRFSDSTAVYQGALGGVDAKLLDALDAIVVGRTRPDLTFVLDLDPAIGLARARARPGAPDRFEGEGAEFHQRLRRAFLVRATQNPERCVLLDASKPPEAVEEDAWRMLQARLAPRAVAAG
jgi:dTMP kinase